MSRMRGVQVSEQDVVQAELGGQVILPASDGRLWRLSRTRNGLRLTRYAFAGTLDVTQATREGEAPETPPVA